MVSERWTPAGTQLLGPLGRDSKAAGIREMQTRGAGGPRVERGPRAFLLQELSWVQHQDGLQGGQAESTDLETLGRAEGQAQALPDSTLSPPILPSV